MCEVGVLAHHGPIKQYQKAALAIDRCPLSTLAGYMSKWSLALHSILSAARPENIKTTNFNAHICICTCMIDQLLMFKHQKMTSILIIDVTHETI